MTKQEIIKAFIQNHQEIINYINSLTNEEFVHSNNGKWTPGQQLSHVYLTIVPFTKVLPSKEFLMQKFGKIDRQVWSCETVIENYLKSSRQAPQQYIPGLVSPLEREALTSELKKVLITIELLLDQFTEAELDSLVIPHPLLGNLTIREMFYLMSYHPKHHLKQTLENLTHLVR